MKQSQMLTSKYQSSYDCWGTCNSVEETCQYVLIYFCDNFLLLLITLYDITAGKLILLNLVYIYLHLKQVICQNDTILYCS